jgi:DNA-binding beta-propeller fold protein YncE
MGSETGKPMILQHLGYIELPPHTRKGGFDHAAYHRADGRLYVAHTANDAVDVIDCAADRYLHSISGLTGVAGVLTAQERDLVFTSNRAEDTVGIFASDGHEHLAKVPVGHRPNGLAYDSLRHVLLVANVGDPAIQGSATASIVDVEARSLVASVPMPGRTRWALFADGQDVFFINIADPPCIVVIEARNPAEIATTFEIPAAGPHGLDLDVDAQRLFCACDAKRLICLDARSGEVSHDLALSGVPDVIFFNAERGRLYVAIGDPGVIDVVDTQRMGLIATIQTEAGAHTIGFDAQRNKIYAFLPGTHRAAVYRDQG